MKLPGELKRGIYHQEGVEVIDFIVTLYGELDLSLLEREVTDDLDLRVGLGGHCDLVGWVMR